MNVVDLMILEAETLHPRSLTDGEYKALFTGDRPVHFNYHGYGNEIKGILFGRPNIENVSIGCYNEEGSTTTPFDMMLRNNVSRYDIMQVAITQGAKNNKEVELEMTTLLGEVRHRASKVKEYVMATGKDPEGTFDVPKFEGTVFGKEEASKEKDDGFFVN